MGGLTCECGHEAQRHGELGCGYLGWHFGTPKCGCTRTAQAAVELIVTAALTEAADAIEGRMARNIGGHPFAERDRGLREAARVIRGMAPPP